MKIFDIYLCHYFATNKKIAITHFWHAMGPQTMYHLIAMDKVAEQKNFQGREHLLGQLIYKNSVAVVVLEKSARLTNACTHARTHRHHFIISPPG